MARSCHRCGREIGEREPVGRRDACLGCSADLHCCLNCQFYAPGAHNDCREPQAERQVDKACGNFCEYFGFRSAAGAAPPPAADAKAALERLFAAKKPT